MIAVDVDKLKGEIADLKATIQIPSCDYVTGYISALSVVEGMIETLPALTLDDLRPKGRWGPNEPEGDVWFHCSECGTEISTSWNYDCDEMWNYCPHCGADMI